MGLISPSQLVDGSTHTAADHNGPIATIANEVNGNLDNTNIKANAGISTTKIAQDGGLGVNALSTGSILLGFAELGTGFTTTSITDVAVAVTGPPAYALTLSGIIVPAGGRKLEVIFAGQLYNTVGGKSTFLTIWDGAVGSGAVVQQGLYTAPSANYQDFTTVSVVLSPTAGSTKSYSIGLHTDSGGTAGISASSTPPLQKAYLLVKAL